MKNSNYIIVAVVFLLVGCNSDPEIDDSITQESVVENVDEQLQTILDKIKNDPNNSNFYHELGYYYYQQGNMQDALNNVYKACAIDTTVAAYYYTLGEIYMHFGAQYGKDELFIDAKTNLDRCVEMDSTNYRALTKLGWLECVMRNYQNALNYLDDALRANEHYAEAYYTKGMVFLETGEIGDTALAASSFLTATEVDATYYDAFIQVGILYALVPSKHEVSENAYRSAIGIDSTRWEAYYDLGILLQDQGRAEEAIEIYQLLTKTAEPNFVDAYYNQGWVYLELMDSLDRALELFTRAIELAPQNHFAFFNRGICYERMGDYFAAEVEFKKALAVKGDYDLAAKALTRIEPYLN